MRPEEGHERFREILALLIQGFTTGVLAAKGKYYEYAGTKVRLRPVQQPYPPIWYPTSSAASMEWIGAQGMNTVVSLLHAPSVDAASAMLANYRAAWQAHRNDPGRANAHVAVPEVALTTHVHVAETDEKAHEQGRTAYALFHENFTRRYVEIGQGEKYANRPSFDEFVRAERILCGSPDTVRRILERHLASSGANHFIGAFAFGSLPLTAAKRSLELFGREVIPALSQQKENV